MVDAPYFQDDIEGYLTFLSCSADGHVTMWTLVKKILRYSSLFEIKSSKQKDVNRDGISNQGQGALHDGGTVLSICPSDKVVNSSISAHLYNTASSGHVPCWV